MTREQAADAIRAEFPDAKVMVRVDRFTQGIGVELANGMRNAVTVGSDDWAQAAEMLLGWMRRIGEPCGGH